MTLKPFDRNVIREIAKIYAHAVVDDLINSNTPKPATNGKAPRSRRVAKTTTKRRQPK